MKYIFFYIIFCLFLNSVSQAQLVSTVAKIQKEIITTRTVHVNALIESIVFQQYDSKKVIKSRLDRNDFSDRLNFIITEMVVFKESQTFGQNKESKAEVNKAFNSWKESLRKNKDLRELVEFLGLTEAEVKAVITQKMISKQFLEFKEKSSYLPTTDAEALNYFQNNKLKFQGSSFEDIKEAIKNEISKEQKDQRIADWLDILRRKYEVSVISPVNS